MPAGYILCANPRSGSTLLCDLLGTAGAGAPDSFFMENPGAEWEAAWGLPTPGTLPPAEEARAHLAAALRAGRGGTPVFGARLMRRDLPRLMAMLALAHSGLPTDRARIEAAFGPTLFIHLTRADRLAQAVSLIKAQQTGLWHIGPDGHEIERLSPPAPPVYDRERIATELARFTALDAAWTDWFAAQGIEPLRLDYDALARDPAATVTTLCSALGLPAPDPARLTPGVAPLADATSRDWIARFRAETGPESGPE